MEDSGSHGAVLMGVGTDFTTTGEGSEEAFMA